MQRMYAGINSLIVQCFLDIGTKGGIVFYTVSNPALACLTFVAT